jgi:hypothetical protein
MMTGAYLPTHPLKKFGQHTIYESKKESFTAEYLLYEVQKE